MIPLTYILRQCKPGYIFSGSGEKINHMLLWMILKLYRKNEQGPDSLIRTVRVLAMTYKWNSANLEKSDGIKFENFVKSDGINLPDGKQMKSLTGD